jgi:hypothetical protein
MESFINKLNMKKIVIVAVAIPFIIILLFMIITQGKGSYKLSGGIARTKTIEESIRRGVFIKEMKYLIIPDTIKIRKNVRFYIERGFRYGKWSANVTDSLNSSDGFKYQLCVEMLDYNNIYIGNYWEGKDGTSQFLYMPDTIYYLIYTQKINPNDSIYKVGELRLF